VEYLGGRSWIAPNRARRISFVSWRSGRCRITVEVEGETVLFGSVVNKV
jgi:hypothetical protein